MSSRKPIKQVRSDWKDIVLVCRKCSKRLDGGFGKKGDETLAKTLRRSTGARKKDRRGPIGVIEVDCLDICPKGAVVAMRATAPGDWAVIPAGAPVAQVIERLGLPTPHLKPDSHAPGCNQTAVGNFYTRAIGKTP